MAGLSRQTIADTLAVAGLRRPRSGPRARERQIRRLPQIDTIGLAKDFPG